MYSGGDVTTKFNEWKLFKDNKLQERNGNVKAIVNDLRNWTINSLEYRTLGTITLPFLKTPWPHLLSPA